MKNRFGKMYILMVLLVAFSVILSSCGDDDPVGPKVDPGFTVVAEFFKGTMGSTPTEALFTYGNSDRSPITGAWVHFSVTAGDGSLVSDSVQTNANGEATCGYRFDGALGHAEIQAMIRNVDTLTIKLRANTIIPGTDGQAQYIRFEDKRTDIISMLGNPERVDIPDPNYWLLVAVYEGSQGLAIVFNDADFNQVWTESDVVLRLIVNGVYSGKTSDSIGIGSTVADFKAVYDTLTGEYDPTPPPGYWYHYDSTGISFFTDTNATENLREVVEIHVYEP